MWPVSRLRCGLGADGFCWRLCRRERGWFLKTLSETTDLFGCGHRILANHGQLGRVPWYPPLHGPGFGARSGRGPQAQDPALPAGGCCSLQSRLSPWLRQVGLRGSAPCGSLPVLAPAATGNSGPALQTPGRSPALASADSRPSLGADQELRPLGSGCGNPG